MSETPRWYVVHTYSGYENKVAQNIKKLIENQGLQELISEVNIPTETVVEYKGDKKREVERKSFPGYVLVKMILTDASWYVIRIIRGVTGFVGPASKPIPLTEEEVAKLGVDVRTVEIDFALGDLVNIISGPMMGLTGRIEKIDSDKDVVDVTVSMFGKDTLAKDLQLSQIEKAQD